MLQSYLWVGGQWLSCDWAVNVQKVLHHSTISGFKINNEKATAPTSTKRGFQKP